MLFYTTTYTDYRDILVFMVGLLVVDPIECILCYCDLLRLDEFFLQNETLLKRSFSSGVCKAISRFLQLQ